MMTGNTSFDLTYPSEIVEGTSIIDVPVDIGSILFARDLAYTPKEGIWTTTIGDEKSLNKLLVPKI